PEVRWWSLGLIPPSESHELALDQGDEADEQRQDDRAGTARAVVLAGAEGRLVELHERRMRPGRLLPDDVEELVERLVGGDEQQQDHRGRGGAQLGQRDVPEGLPASLGAVAGGG